MASQVAKSLIENRGPITWIYASLLPLLVLFTAAMRDIVQDAEDNMGLRFEALAAKHSALQALVKETADEVRTEVRDGDKRLAGIDQHTTSLVIQLDGLSSRAERAAIEQAHLQGRLDIGLQDLRAASTSIAQLERIVQDQQQSLTNARERLLALEREMTSSGAFNQAIQEFGCCSLYNTRWDNQRQDK